MCDMCDGASPGRLRREMRQMIRTYGWALQYVESGVSENGSGEIGIRPAHCYTIGHTERGRPELILTGRVADQSADVLNELGTWMAAGYAPRPGDRHDLGGLHVYIVEVRQCESWLARAVDFYGPIRALQVVWADCLGLLPWEGPGDGTLVQPLLGPPPVRGS